MEKSAKMRRLRLPARGAVGYTAANLLIKSVGMLTTPFFTRLLGSSEFGRYSLYMSVLGILSVTLSAFFSSGVIYRGLQSFSSGKDGFLVSGMAVSFGICTLICPLLFTFLPVLGLEASFAPIISLQVFLDSVVSLKCAELRFGYKYMAVGGIGLVSALVSPLLGAVLISGAGLSYRGRIYGILISSLMVAIPILATTVRVGRARLGDCRYILRHASPLLPHTASGAMWGQLDKLLIGSLIGVTALAKYAVAHSLGIALTLLTGGISSALLPWTMRRLAEGGEERVKQINGEILRALSAAVLLTVGLAPELMRLLAPAEYSDALSAVAPIALSALPSFAVSIAAYGAVFCGRSGLTVIPSLVGVAVSLMSNLLLLPLLGFLGAGLSLLLSQLLSLCACMLLSGRYNCRIIEPLPLLRIILTTALASAPSVLFYSVAWARVLLLIYPAILALSCLFRLRTQVTETA